MQIIESIAREFPACQGLCWENDRITQNALPLFIGTPVQVAERWEAIKAFLESTDDEDEINEFFSEIFIDSAPTEIDEACAKHDFSHMSTPELNKHITKKLKNAAAHNLSQSASEHLQAAQKEYKRRTRLGESLDELKANLKGDMTAFIKESVLDEVSAAAMGRAIEHDWTSNLEPETHTQAVKHPKHAGTAINNVNRAHPASNAAGHKFAVLHHDGKGWQVSKHERIETAAREFARHSSKPGAKVKIVDHKGSTIHSTFEMEILDDELQALRESEFIE